MTSRPDHTISHKRTPPGTQPVATGLVVGLGWGLLVSLLDGLPLLLQGSMVPHLGSRLLALAYTAAIYGTLGGVAGVLLGGVVWVVLRFTRHRLSRTTLAGIYAGLFTTSTVVILGLQGFDQGAIRWIVLLVLGLVLGLVIGWFVHAAARGKALSWPVIRSAVLVAYLTAIVAVFAVAGFRALSRDQPLFGSPSSGETASTGRPNIVLITAAGLRPDHLGAYGYEAPNGAITPSIDALAQRGTRFKQAIAPSSWTAPSLASILTSLYPSELAIACRAAISCQPHLDEQRTTLAEALGDAGYRTGAYLTSPWLTAELGFDQGFQQFESVRAREPFDLGPMQGRALGSLLGCRRGAAACRLYTAGHGLLFDAPIPAGWGGDRVNSRVNQFLEQYGDERFFLWIHYSEALPPYNLEPPFWPPPEGPLANSTDFLKGMGYWRLGDSFAPRERLLPLDVEGLTSLYDGEVHRVDRLVGGLTGQLEAQGLADRTLVVFTSDHGQEFMEHGGYTYGHSLYDEVLQVPLILAGPGISPGESVDTQVALLDLAPTLVEIAGAAALPEAEGRSVVPVLHGEALEEKPIFSESLYRVPQELKAIRRDGLELIYNVDDNQLELYDLNIDPAEQQNLAAEAVDVAQALMDELMSWMAHTTEVGRELPRSAPPQEFTDAVW